MQAGKNIKYLEIMCESREDNSHCTKINDFQNTRKVNQYTCSLSKMSQTFIHCNDAAKIDTNTLNDETQVHMIS